MKYPGTNKLVLNAEALKTILADAMNNSQEATCDTIRILTVGRSGYGSDMEFEFTTDLETTTKEI